MIHYFVMLYCIDVISYSSPGAYDPAFYYYYY